MEPLRSPGGSVSANSSTKPMSKSKGARVCLDRAVDKEGKTVDFLPRAKRDVAAAKAFFRGHSRATADCRVRSTLDGYQASHRAAKEVLDEHSAANQCEIRSSKYLNNLIEQDHRSTKLRLGPMLGFKHFRRAATTIAGIELMHRIRKGSVHTREAWHQEPNHSRDLECGSFHVIYLKRKSACSVRLPQFAPEPPRVSRQIGDLQVALAPSVASPSRASGWPADHSRRCCATS